MIKLCIVGYGKMGRMIEGLLDDERFRDFEIHGKYDINNPVNQSFTECPNVAIEFTTPKSVIDNIEFISSKGVNIVCGTTGWYDKVNYVKEIIEKNGTGFIYASNFSIGVNLFFQIIKYSSELMAKQRQYNVSVEETHHVQKIDKPSGTAIRLAEYIMLSYKNKKRISCDNNSPSEDELNIASFRKPDIVGNHRVIFDSTADTIMLEHNAKSRIGFAEGALLAARYIYNRKGFYRFEDIFTELI